MSPKNYNKHDSREEKRHHKDDEKCQEKCESSSSSDTEDDCHDSEDLYCYFKHKLLKDNHMMIAGSDAYWNSWSKSDAVLLQNAHPKLEEDTIAYNIDHPTPTSPGFVREDGVYIVFFISESAESSQFTVFVNGEPNPNTTTGNNAGAGQLILRWMLPLKKNDNVTVRNYQSSIGALTMETKSGGLLDSLNFGITLLKIASLEEYCWDKEYKFDYKKKHLFRELEEKLLCDKSLQMKGFNIHGSFFNKNTQTVATEAPVVFNQMDNVYGLCPIKNNIPMTGSTGASFSQIRIEEDGIYKCFFLCTTDTAAQFAMFVNGVAVPYTVNGTNKGAGQLTIRVIFKLKKNDILTVNNHTSGNSQVVLSQDAGGQILGLSAIFIIFKLAGDMCELPKYNEKWEKRYDSCLYNEFKGYLLGNKYTQPSGSDAFLSVTSTTPQTLAIEESLIWNTVKTQRNIKFTPGKAEVIINRTGDYDIFADIISDRPSQYTVFVNNQPMLNTTSGRDSGANRILLRQIIHLRKGDVVTVRNYKSILGSITTAQNTGGNFVNASATFMIFKLSNPRRQHHIK